MRIQEHETTQTDFDHDCHYANRLAYFREKVATPAIRAYGLDKVVAKLHTEPDACPPTHIDSNPTKEWEEILDYTRL